MLSRAIRIGQQARRVSPWTNVYGLARTLLATGTLLTLLSNSSTDLFPLSGGAAAGPVCRSTAQISAFCVAGPAPAHYVAVVILVLVAIGWRPRLTGIPHWYVTYSVGASIHTVEGGDHLAAILTLLLVPVTLTDGRRWHWGAPAAVGGVAAAFTAHSGLAVARVQMAVVYLHASLAKLTVPEWQDGTALYYWLSDETFGYAAWLRPLMQPLLQNAWTVAALTWAAVLLEFVLALGLFASPRQRRWLLVAGLSLHGTIALIMGLVTFAFAMAGGLVIYLCRPEQTFHLPRLKKDSDEDETAQRAPAGTDGSPHGTAPLAHGVR
jgi:antimicrobial peptide system SdpB family protein